jgi:phage-related protein
LNALPTDARAAMFEAFQRRQRGTHLPNEDEKIRKKIRAIRTSLGGRTYRAMYASVGPRDRLCLHVFEKKSQKTPQKAIERAEKRLKDWETRRGMG